MQEPFIVLSPEITRENALTLIKWMQDDEVTKFLTDTQDVSEDIRDVVDRVQLPVLTHFFNQNGRFFMAYNQEDHPIGFVRLATKNKDSEIVVTIGDRNNWGKKLGPCAIRESMKVAFFEMRSERVIANIDKRNIRSVKAFLNAGFISEGLTRNVYRFSITMADYLASIKDGKKPSEPLYISEFDKERLQKIIHEESLATAKEEKIAKELEQELAEAVTLPPEKVPDHVVTMNSKAIIDLDGEEMEVSLVYPKESDWENNKLSIISHIGSAIIGYKEGEIVEKEFPTGEKSEIFIKEIIYQPEAAGDYDL